MILAVQAALRGGATLEQLGAELGIQHAKHEHEPLVTLRYHQCDSPAFHPVVRECRGLVLETGTWDVVAKPFDRFYNVGQEPGALERFNWGNCTATTKEDGSLLILYRYRDRWRVNTRGTFGDGLTYKGGPTFAELFWRTAPFGTARLDECFHDRDEGVTLCFELCAPENKVVRTYPKGRLFLLGATSHWPACHTNPLVDLPFDRVNDIAQSLGCERPTEHRFASLGDVEAFLLEQEQRDPSFEGVVLQDSTGLRLKAKTRTHLALAHMKDNGNLFLPKNLVPWALKDDPAELLTFFPEARERLAEVQGRLGAELAALQALRTELRGTPVQKDFALRLRGRTPFPGLLFALRKAQGPGLGTPADLIALWRGSDDLIVKTLYR